MQNEEPGLAPIGNQITKICASLKTSGSTPNEPQTNSVTTGLPNPARKASSLTGLQRGATGAGGTPSVYRTDQGILAQLPPPVRSWIKAHEVVETERGEDGQFECVRLIRYDGVFPDGEARAIIEAAMEPAIRNKILARVASMWEMTSHAQTGGDNLKLKFAGYAALLMEYPADVAHEALTTVENRMKWFPAKSELKDICDDLVHWRRVTLKAMEG